MSMVDCKGKWIPQVLGDVNGDTWEVSVIRSDFKHGRISYGWFDENKLLVSSNGGPCHDPLAKGLGEVMVSLAHGLASKLNKDEE